METIHWATVRNQTIIPMYVCRYHSIIADNSMQLMVLLVLPQVLLMVLYNIYIYYIYNIVI